MNNSFNTIAKALLYTLLVFLVLLGLCPRLFGIFIAGIVIMSVVMGGLRRTTMKLSVQYVEEKTRLI